MSRRDIWAYDPDICDGDFCPQDCDRCPKREKVIEKQTEGEEEKIVLTKDRAVIFTIDDDEAQIQVIKDMKKYGLAIMKPREAKTEGEDND